MRGFQILLLATGGVPILPVQVKYGNDKSRKTVGTEVHAFHRGGDCYGQVPPEEVGEKSKCNTRNVTFPAKSRESVPWFQLTGAFFPSIILNQGGR